jgi:hypothetical protein
MRGERAYDAPMALEQVDVVQLESLEGGLDRLEDVLWGH